MSPETTTCSCGGRFHLDIQYLFDARRFSLLGRVPILWRCTACGRSMIEGSPVAVQEDTARERRRMASTHRRQRHDGQGEALDSQADTTANQTPSVPSR